MIEKETFFSGKVRLFAVPVCEDERGTLAPFDFAKLPFVPKRVFVIEGTPANATRGGHAHAREEQLLVALGGEIRVGLHYQGEEREVTLSSSREALWVGAGVWFQQNYSGPEAKLMVFASAPHDPGGYTFSKA